MRKVMPIAVIAALLFLTAPAAAAMTAAEIIKKTDEVAWTRTSRSVAVQTITSPGGATRESSQNGRRSSITRMRRRARRWRRRSRRAVTCCWTSTSRAHGP